MKKVLFVMAAVLFFCGISAADASAQDRLIFRVGSNVCTPVTVTCCGNSYTVYGTLEIDRPCSSVYISATDCNGNKLKYDFGSSSGTKNGESYSISTYTFKNADGYSYDDYSGNTYGSNAYAPDYELAEKTGAALAAGIFSLGGGADGKAYPSLKLLPGVSWAYGENIRVRYTGHGMNFYAGIGKDFLFGSPYKNKILWHVGIGSYFAFGNYDPDMDISVGLSFGQLAQFEKISMMIDLDYTYWIGRWRRIGIFAGGGVGWSNFVNLFDVNDVNSKTGFAYNFEAGLAIRIANF